MTRNTVSSSVLCLSVILAACGGTAGSSGVIGPEGGTVTAPGVALKVAPGAVSAPTKFEIVEAQPNDGAIRRIEIEPKGLDLPTGATLRVEMEGDAGADKMVEMEHAAESETESEHGIETEHHDIRHNAREAQIHHTGTFEVRHGAVCNPGCGTGEECDDGVCKPEPELEPEDAGTVAGGITCPAGTELDATGMTCKPHGGASGGSGTGM
jgi:hypothetical protein